jgi:RNase P/RNase MRP subunit p30
MNENQILITQKEFNKLKNEVNLAISKSEGKEIIYSSDDDDLNRKVIEKLPVDVLLINLNGRKDYQKQRNSGFNQVMAKVMKKKNIVLGINFDEIIESKNLKEKSEILARIKQNIFLCKKNNVNMKFIFKSKKNERNIYDLKSLGLVLGMDTKMISKL